MLTTTRRSGQRDLLREVRGRYEVGPVDRVVRERSGGFVGDEAAAPGAGDAAPAGNDTSVAEDPAHPGHGVEDRAHPVHGVEPPPGAAFVDDTPPSPDDLVPPAPGPAPSSGSSSGVSSPSACSCGSPAPSGAGSVRGPVGTVARAVGLLASVDESRPAEGGLPDGSELTGLVATLRGMDLLAAEAVRLAGQLDGVQAVREEGMTVDAALRLHTGTTRGDVSMVLTASEVLASMPVTAGLFARGVFTWAHIRALTAGARTFDVATRTALDTHLAEQTGQLERLDGEGRLWAVDDAIAQHTPAEALEDRAERDADTRTLIITPRLDGSGTIFTDLDVEGFATVTNRLDAEADTPLASASPGDVGTGLPRTMLEVLPGSRPQLLADALVHICADRAGRGGVPVRFTVIVDAAQVTDTFAGTLQPVVAAKPPRIVRRAIDRLTCDAAIDVVIRDGHDLLAAQRYAPDLTVAVRRAVHTRDAGCRFPGCRAPAVWCDIHHLTPREAHGHHGLNNLVALCRRHHVIIHRRGWRQHLDPDGTYTVTRNHRTWTTLPRHATVLPPPTRPPGSGDPPGTGDPPGHSGDPPGSSDPPGDGPPGSEPPTPDLPDQPAHRARETGPATIPF